LSATRNYSASITAVAHVLHAATEQNVSVDPRDDYSRAIYVALTRPSVDSMTELEALVRKERNAVVPVEASSKLLRLYIEQPRENSFEAACRTHDRLLSRAGRLALETRCGERAKCTARALSAVRAIAVACGIALKNMMEQRHRRPVRSTSRAGQAGTTLTPATTLRPPRLSPTT
jgi:hypothetical protein